MKRLTTCFVIVLSFVVLSAPASAADRLVVLGDSISAGHGIESGAGWVDLFKAKLADDNSAIEVVNESISGEVTAGGLARLPDVLERIQPRWLVIELGGNDGLRGLSPKAMGKNLQSMVEMAKEKDIAVFLFGMKLPPNYGKQYNLLFEKTFEKVAKQQQVPLLPFFLEGVGGVENLMQDDGVHPNVNAQSILFKNAWDFLSPHILKQP